MSLSAIRALARVARRDIVRHRARSLLVTLLVLLPVAAMVAGIALFRTTLTSPERQTIAYMGRAELVASGTTAEALTEYLPDGSVVERTEYGEAHLVLPGARPGVLLRALDLDGLASGILTVVEGRGPHGTSEVAITRAVSAVAGIGIGGQLSMVDRPTATVVGLVENPLNLGDQIVVVDPEAGPLGPDDGVVWLVDLPDGVDAVALVEASTDPETGAQDVLIQARTTWQLESYGGDSTSGYILILGSLALVEAALIASAAFAVSIRRRQRELGLLAATGATPRQLSGIVVLGAAILGLLACLGGVVLGIAGVLALSPWLDELTQRRNESVVVDLAGIVGPVVIGFVAAIVAAIVPARTVARVPVLVALSGRRPAQATATKTFRTGLGLVALAAAMTVIGATMPNAGLDGLSIGLLAGGAVLSVLGFGACGPWLLERFEGLATRLPLAGRIAFRDTARARSRNSSIVTAILASCAAAVAIGAWQTSRDAEDVAGWRPDVYPDEIRITGPGAVAIGQELLDEPGVIAGTEVPLLVPADSEIWTTYQLPDARDPNGRLIDLTDQCGNCNPEAFQAYNAWLVSPGTAELLKMAHAESAADELRQGHAVVITYRPLTATYLEILFQRDALTEMELVRRLTLPVHVIVAAPYGTLPQVFLPDETIADLGLVPAESDQEVGGDPGGRYVLQYDHPVTAADIERAQEVASRVPDTVADSNTPPERPGEGFRMLTIGLVLLFAVSVTGIAIALGEAESRPEQRSLLALGADPGLRRRIVAARAAFLALLAGVLAVPAGLLPIWGMFVSRGSPVGVPTLEIIGALVALPVLAVLSAFLLSRPIPDWNAFRKVGAGE